MSDAFLHLPLNLVSCNINQTFFLLWHCQFRQAAATPCWGWWEKGTENTKRGYLSWIKDISFDLAPPGQSLISTKCS
jgi:hypothetical protein